MDDHKNIIYIINEEGAGTQERERNFSPEEAGVEEGWKIRQKADEILLKVLLFSGKCGIIKCGGVCPPFACCVQMVSARFAL
ncbi:MAG: hypothetical protein IJ507_00140 [Clostridia bacterium]|nr:hypothetical protein [Clostridia bacterium]